MRELELDKPRPKKVCAGDTTFDLIAACLKALYDEVNPYIKDAVAFVKYGRVLRDDEFTKAIKNVTGNLVLKSYEDTYVVEIQYRDEDADRAAAVANTLARLFINFLKEMRSSEAKELVSRLQETLRGASNSWWKLANVCETTKNHKGSSRPGLNMMRNFGN